MAIIKFGSRSTGTIGKPIQTNHAPEESPQPQGEKVFQMESTFCLIITQLYCHHPDSVAISRPEVSAAVALAAAAAAAQQEQ